MAKKENKGGEESEKDEMIECFICVEPCRALCVFACGHYVCYACGLRVQSLAANQSCPACREKSTVAIITNQLLPQEEEKYSREELALLHAKEHGEQEECRAVKDKKLKCMIDDPFLAIEMKKLYAPLCPFPQCWQPGGYQEPFVHLAILKEHLKVEHGGMTYCEVCLKSRPAFLCEQIVYSQTALQQHMDGICPYDSESFTGHPPCKFCKDHHHHRGRQQQQQHRDPNNNNNNNNEGKGGRTNIHFYDGETLLKHMQQDHFTCDICNMGQYRFTFYQNREKLYEHFDRQHKICDHPDCASLDPMMKVFKNSLDLGLHKQRVHNIKLKPLELSELGMVEDDIASYNNNNTSSSGGGRGEQNSVPATGSNVNVIYIIFDFIYRQEKVEMIPTNTSQKGQHNNKGKKKKNQRGGNNNNNNNQEETTSVGALVPISNGLPAHYYSSSSFPILRRRVKENPMNISSPTTANTTTTTTNNNNNSTVSSRNRNSENNVSAFRIAEDNDTYQRKNNIPHDPEEQRALLNSLLRKNIPNPSLLNEFKVKTKEFMEGRLLTVQYYELLRGHFFVDRQDELETVYPLLVATVPDAQKKIALREVWKMKSAPEYQRQEKIKLEEQRKKQEEEKWNYLKSGKTNTAAAALSSSSSNQHNNDKGKTAPSNAAIGKTAWGKRPGTVTLQKNAWQAGKPPSNTNNNNNNHHHAQEAVLTKRWGLEAGGGGARTTAPPVDDATAFPSLAEEYRPTRDTVLDDSPTRLRGRHGNVRVQLNNSNRGIPTSSSKGKKGKSNAWFSNNNNNNN